MRQLGAEAEKDMEEWAACESRGPFVRNSMKQRIAELRGAAARARKAYRKDYMGKPYSYIADAYDEAADVLQKRLDAVTPNAKIEGSPLVGDPSRMEGSA